VSDPAAVTATEAANIINETLSYMMTLTDDQGEPVNQEQGGHVVIVVTKVNHRTAFELAITLNNLNQSTDNPVNVSRRKGFTFEVVYAPGRLTAANTVKFFMGQPGSVYSALILQDELGGVQTQLVGAGSEEEFWNDRHVFGVKAIRGVGYGMWQKSAMVTLS
jgi:hypothetical protein